jgi:hypothetical protein
MECERCENEEKEEVKSYSVSDREDACGDEIALCKPCADEEKEERERESVGWCIER